MSLFTLQIDQNGIGNLIFDMPNSSVNLLSSAALLELEAKLDEIAKNKELKALLITSAKKGIFIAGADISEIEDLTQEDEAYDKVRRGQMILAKITALEIPSIAVINGACLGGGFELALRCSYRICTENPQTKIGLPEVNLGVLPGFGGTQKLKHLIGPSKAIELILEGKVINGAKALKLGMVDICVPEGYLDFRIMPFVTQILTGKGKAEVLKRRHKNTLIERFFPSLIWKFAYKSVMAKTKGHYPAALGIIALFKKTQGMPIARALNFEARAFAELAITPISKNLISLFYALEGIKNEKSPVAKEQLIPLHITAVIGGGTMGGGIVWLLSKMDLLVRLKVRGFAQAGHTFQAVAKAYDSLKRRRRLNEREIDMKMAHISYGIDYKSLQHSDLAIEAIVESVEAKQECYKELEEVMRDDAIIASNTSSLSMSMLSAKMKHPERFIGMHFFNPVPQMPLIEVIPGEKTKPEVVATIVDMAKKAGKTPIVVGDCAGFLVNRILLPYINESAKMLEEGADIAQVDKAIENFGMPMGPFTLADEVGLDVGYKVAKVLENSYGERMEIAPILDTMYNKLKLLGKKDKRGFYIHDGKNKSVNSAVSSLKQGKHKFGKDEIVDRAMLIMVNEAARCLEEGVVKDARHLDVAMIMGTGFPPFRGGLMKYADSVGLDNILSNLERLEQDCGTRFAPAQLIVTMAKAQKTFYKG